MHTSIIARIALVLAILASVLFVGMPLGVRTGGIPSALGFRLFMLGAAVGLLALLFGLVGLWRTRASSGRSGRGGALFAVASGLLIAGVVGWTVVSTAHLPVINDISTDLEDPPEFRALAEHPANAERNMAYPDDFVVQQRAGYPELDPIEVSSPPSAAFANAQSAMESLGWEIVRSDPDAREIEAIETTATFRFVDDVVVRVRPSGSGSRIDVRSKSRDGRGDLGANAARIERLREALKR